MTLTVSYFYLNFELVRNNYTKHLYKSSMYKRIVKFNDKNKLFESKFLPYICINIF